MKKNTLLVILTIVIVLLAVFALYKKQTIQHVTTNSLTSEKFGKYLTDDKGLTLYIFSTDPNSEKACDYKCLKYWKPFVTDLANGGSESFISKKYNFGDKISIIKRSDGLYQYTYDGKLLYKFVGDQKSGDMLGLNYADKKWVLINL